MANPNSTTFGGIVRHGGAWLTVIAASGLFGTIAILALPTVLGRTVDALVAQQPADRWLLLAAGLVVTAAGCDLVDAYAGTACAARTCARLRHRLVGHLLALGPTGASRFDTGDLGTRVGANAADAARAGPSVLEVTIAALPPAGSLVLLAVLDVRLAVAFAIGVLAVVAVLSAFTRRTSAVMTEYQHTQGRIAARLTEALTGSATIAAAGTVDAEHRRVTEPLGELRRLGRDTWRILGRSGAQAAIVGPIVLLAVTATGGWLLAADRLSPGELFAAGQYAVIGAGLGGLTGVLGELARARAGTRRLAEVLDLTASGAGMADLPAGGDGTVEFTGVVLDPGLNGVDLVVPGGMTVAVVGRSGAGKSALAALAAGLRRPDRGCVRLDGVPVTDLRGEVRRDAIGCAFEQPVLVGATIADAIGPERSRATVVAAALAVHADHFIRRLPDGYDTPPSSAPLSGGERQRLGLARAWPAERLLVLDDATSHLDTVTETLIGRTLTDRSGCTRLVITHRPATAARCDLVVWLDAGRVRAVGTHAELLAEPEYRRAFG